MICRSIRTPAWPGTKYTINDGTDWSLGTTSKIGQLPHDGGMGLDGNLYYTVNNPNNDVTVGKVDAKTGEVKYLKVNKDGQHRRDRPRPHPRRRRQLLVRHQSGPPQPRQARRQDREDHRLPDAAAHVAARRRRDHGRRRQGQGLGFGAGRRPAVRSGDREVHRLQVDDCRSRTPRAPTAPMAPRATATAMAGGRRWRSTPSARPTWRPARPRKSRCRRSRTRWHACRRHARVL